MSEFIHIKEVTIEPKSITAAIEVADNMPLNTSEDIQATARVYNLMPQITEHACMGEGTETFRDAMGNTSIAHLFEHVAVELLSMTEPDEDITCGRTWVDEDDDHVFHVQLGCSNDLMGCGALSSAAWIMHWAFADPEAPEPNIEGIVKGLVALPDVYNEKKKSFTSEEEAVLSQIPDDVFNEGSATDLDDDKTPQKDAVSEPEMLSNLSGELLDVESATNLDDDKSAVSYPDSEAEILSNLDQEGLNVESATDLDDDKTPQPETMTEGDSLKLLSDDILSEGTATDLDKVEKKDFNKPGVPSSIHIEDDFEV